LQTKLQSCLACAASTAWVICTSSHSVVYRRLRLLGTARGRDRFVRILEQVGRRYRFVVVGYVAGGPSFRGFSKGWAFLNADRTGFRG
jgi:hypothetical protein